MEDVKGVIGRLSALQNEMITNKPIRELTSEGGDVPLWNAFLREENSTHDFPAAWYDSSWLYVECYLYRRMREAFELSSLLKDYDPFYKQKVSSLASAMDDMAKLGTSLLQTTLQEDSSDLFKTFATYLEISLWGNKCDLSISAGKEITPASHQVEELKSKILVNDTEKVWCHLKRVKQTKNDVHIHLILDNAGFELFCDFCFLHVLLTAKLASKVSIHVKQMPWFVSDTLERDIQCLLETLSRSGCEDLVELSRLWLENFAAGVWKIESEPFWTLPHDYSKMSSVDPGLYSKLSKADLLIFKGDLNYRKLTGDRQWAETTPFRRVLNGFLPASLVSLRTVKADVIVGLPPGMTERLEQVSQGWKITGEYAVVQCELAEHV